MEGIIYFPSGGRALSRPAWGRALSVDGWNSTTPPSLWLLSSSSLLSSLSSEFAPPAVLSKCDVEDSRCF
jgi:hypothetical protein